MKKRILGVAFGAAILFACSFTSMNKAEAQTPEPDKKKKIRCPEGDKYTCYTIDNIIVAKGKGEVVIEE